MASSRPTTNPPGSTPATSREEPQTHTMSASRDSSADPSSGKRQRIWSTVEDNFNEAHNKLMWLKHTMNQDSTRRSLKAELSKSIIDKLDLLAHNVSEMAKEASITGARLEEARSLPEKIVNKFALVLAERDAKQQVEKSKSDGILKDLLQKISLLARSFTHSIPQDEAMVTDLPSAPSYSEVTKNNNRSRSSTKKPKKHERNTNKETKASARSKSRIKKGKETIGASRTADPTPAFFLENGENETLTQAKARLWSQILKKTRAPKLQLVNARSGKLVLKPQDKDTTDILKSLARGDPSLSEEAPKWPRIIVFNIDTDVAPDALPENIANQNPQLGDPTVTQ